MAKGRITTDHRDALYRLARAAKDPKALQEVEAARKDLVAKLGPIIKKAWPTRDMKVLRKYGLASERNSLTVLLGDGCTCEKVDVPIEGLGLLIPASSGWGSPYAKLDISGHAEAKAVADIYLEAVEASEGKDESLVSALKALVGQVARPGTSADRLIKIKELWPAPEVAEICDQAMAGDKVPTEPEATNIISGAFAQEAA